MIRIALAAVVGSVLAAGGYAADVPTASSWVWYPERPATDCVGHKRYLRRVIHLNGPLRSGRLRVLCDDSFHLRVNGAPAPKPVETGRGGSVFDLTQALSPGRNALAFEVFNAASRGGLMVTGTIVERDGTAHHIHSDTSFRASKTAADGWDRPGFDDSKWRKAAVIDSAFGAPWFSHAAFDLDPFITPADRERWNAWRAKILAAPDGLKHEAPARAKFASVNGSCAFVINDSPRPALIYRGTVDSLSKHGRRQIGLFRDAGVHVYTAYTQLAGFWPEPGVYRFDRLDDIVRGYLSADPDAHIILILRLVPPKWWMEAHPEELVRYAAGKDFNTSDECGRVRRASLASKLWRRDLLALWNAAIEHLESMPWGKRVIGYQPGYGIYTEWHYFGSWTDQMPDTGPAMTAHFRTWLRSKYGTAQKLRAAWGDPHASLDSATVPGVEPRLAAGPLGLRRPVVGRRVMDYYHCQQEVTADDIEAFCASAKKITGGRVVCGAFYGYFYGVLPQTQGGHLELERLLESPSIDYFAAPYDYNHRLMGDDGRLKSIMDAFAAAGKVHMIEADTRTYLHPRNEYGRLADRAQSIAAIRREVATALTHHCALWWCDFGGNGTGGWYDDPALIGEVKHLVQEAQTRLKHPRKHVSQVALVCDLRSCYWLGDRDAMRTHRALVDRVTTELYRTGTPFDTILLSQLGTDIPADRYRLLIFLNPLRVTPAQRRTLADAVRGRSVLWLWAPGITDGQRFGTDLVQALTGFRVRLDGQGEHVSTVECPGNAPLVAGIPVVVDQRLAVRKTTSIPQYRDPKRWYNPRTDEVMQRDYTKFAWHAEGHRFVWTFAKTRGWTDIHLRAQIAKCDGLRLRISGSRSARGGTLRVVVKGADGGEFVAPALVVARQPAQHTLPFAAFTKAPWDRGTATRIAFPLRGLKMVLNSPGGNRVGQFRLDELVAVDGSQTEHRARRYGDPGKLVPVLTIDDPEAVVLGRATATGHVVLACKGKPGARRVFSTLPFVPRQLLTALMADSSVTRYVPANSGAGVIVRADSKLVSLHTAGDRKFTLQLPVAGPVHDALSGRVLGHGPTFEIALPRDSTTLLRLGKRQSEH